MHIILQTPRLILRQFTEADAPLIYQLNSDPDITRYIHEVPLRDEAHALEIITGIILPQYERRLGRWAVFTKHNNEFIGWCGLKWVAEINEIDLGYRFMKYYWGMGYATEAAQHVLDYGLNELKLPQIIGRVHADNIASQKVLEKIGLQFVKNEMEDGEPIKIYTSSKI